MILGRNGPLNVSHVVSSTLNYKYIISLFVLSDCELDTERNSLHPLYLGRPSEK